MSDRPKVAVLVPAAGRGARMGGTRKQYRELGGKPILHQTADVFESHPDVTAIVVAAPSTDVTSTSNALRSAGISKLFKVVAGGSSRQESVSAALAVLPPSMEVVLVHDAVRPFVRPEHITAVIDAVLKFGAAALAVPLLDTLRKGNDGIFGTTVPRQGLYGMQTPQGFRRDWFDEAHRQARAVGSHETDDVALVQRLGHEVKIVEGTSTNIKITTPEDWALAQAIWESTRARA